MNKDKPTEKEFFDNLHKQFPQLEMVRKHELKRQANLILQKSTIGKIASIAYFILAVVSIVIYWKLANISFIVSLFLGVITWFVLTYIFDKLIIKLSGLDKAIQEASDKDIQDSKDALRNSGIFK